ncbi:MAG: hypothetical protein ACD_63C00180G0014 [uncultured bacterium]|nr:MAG: hypothetical protein ACD_63C00180G0014 [uncultured bacterium]
MKLLVTGALGFMGSAFVRHILKKYKNYKITNLDKVTYAANFDNLKSVEKDKRYKFVRGDVSDPKVVNRIAKNADAIVNYAAETHVDRSISKPDDFIQTDVYGTYVLLEAAKKYEMKRFVQVSTDEVYGEVMNGRSKETDMLFPSSPYSASKAGGDMLVLGYFRTYAVSAILTRASNNYGPYQYPEKIIPLFITNILEGKKVPVYGKGGQVRDWLYVEDHARAIDEVLHKGKSGEIYNIGSDSGKNITNMQVTKKVLKFLGKDEKFIEHVKDRPGHDRRYAINCDKIKKLGWKPKMNFSEGIKKTVDWYKNNEEWWKKIKSGEFLEYYKRQYG